MADLVTPQFKVPFTIQGADVGVVEQDSDEDVEQNVTMALRYERGERTAVRDYGVADQALRQGGANAAEIIFAITRWEPGADVDVVADALDVMSEQVVTIQPRMEN